MSLVPIAVTKLKKISSSLSFEYYILLYFTLYHPNYKFKTTNTKQKKILLLLLRENLENSLYLKLKLYSLI